MKRSLCTFWQKLCHWFDGWESCARNRSCLLGNFRARTLSPTFHSLISCPWMWSIAFMNRLIKLYKRWKVTAKGSLNNTILLSSRTLNLIPTWDTCNLYAAGKSKLQFSKQIIWSLFKRQRTIIGVSSGRHLQLIYLVVTTIIASFDERVQS